MLPAVDTQRSCPHCEGESRLLVYASNFALVDYYLCNQCGRVSKRPKDKSAAAKTDVTHQDLRSS